MKRTLVTGALGQIGSELTPTLREKYGADRVLATDVRMRGPSGREPEGPFEYLDCTYSHQVQEIIRKFDVGVIYHLAALLSAVAEERPHIAWEVNMVGVYNVLEAARQNRCAVFFPSSIGAFGPSTPRDRAPQETIERPITMYGVTKVAGELLCDYYHQRFGVDTRGVRYPGIISHVAPPGGGTTDYAVEMFYGAIRHKTYTCFLRPDTRLDMMYMPDAVKAAVDLMRADPSGLRHRNAYNLAAMNFTPEGLAEEIRKHVPGFEIQYAVDPVRQAIADSWPDSVDDGAAREDWGWKPDYDLAATTREMLEKLAEKPGIRASRPTA